MAVCPDRREEILEVDRLLKVHVGMHPVRAFLPVVCSGQADNRHMGVALIRQLPAAKLVSAHHRHHQIQQNDGRTRIVEALQGLDAVGCRRYRETFAFEHDRQHLAQVEMILDDEDAAGRVHYCPPAIRQQACRGRD